MSEYPKALIRPGSEFEWEGRLLDMRMVADADEETAARVEGWRHAAEPEEAKPAPKRKK